MKRFILVSVIFAICLLALCSCDLLPCKHTEAVDAAVAPTCTEAGLTEGKHCSKCGEVLAAQQTVAPLGHTEKLEESKAPTCTEDGYTAGISCSVCQAVLVEKETIPASHTYGEWVTLSESDCFFEGDRQRICSVCDYTEVGKLAKLEHSFALNETTGLFHCEKCNGRVYAGHLYAEFDVRVNWYDAYKICDEMGGYLVTVTSQGEQDIITDMFKEKDLSFAKPGGDDYFYWMGAIENSDGWHWVTGEEFIYENWGSKEPDDWTAQWHAGFTTSYKENSSNSHVNVGEWEDLSHNANEGFICEWELDITESEHYFTEWETVIEVSCFGDGEDYRVCTHCGLEETRVIKQLEHSFSFDEASGLTSCEHCGAAMYEGRIYRIFEQEVSWFDAYKLCESMGGHLVTVTSAEEQTFINNYMTQISFFLNAWMGAYNDGSKWQWITDEAFEYTSWASGQPDNLNGKQHFCVLYKDSFGTWDDQGVTQLKGFMCEWEAE